MDDERARELEDIVEQLRRAVAEAKAGTENKLDFIKAVTSNRSQDLHSEKGNKFDVKSVLESKEKKEAAHAKAIERRIEKEMEACTFKPTVNRKSMEIAAEKGHKFTPIAERRPKEPPAPPEPLPTAPLINPHSRALAERKERPGPVHDRLMQLVAERQRRLDARAAEQARRELDAVTGTPQIDRRSHEILRRKVLDGQVRPPIPRRRGRPPSARAAFGNHVRAGPVRAVGRCRRAHDARKESRPRPQACGRGHPDAAGDTAAPETRGGGHAREALAARGGKVGWGKRNAGRRVRGGPEFSPVTRGPVARGPVARGPGRFRTGSTPPGVAARSRLASQHATWPESFEQRGSERRQKQIGRKT